MKTAFFALLTAFLLFSCSTDDEQLQLNEDFSNTISKNSVSANSNKTSTQPPLFLPDTYYTYTVTFNKHRSSKEKSLIRYRYFNGPYGFFLHQPTDVENVEIWYTTFNPALQEPGVEAEATEDDDIDDIQLGDTFGN